MTQENEINASGLYVVATPIGNLDDISPRAIQVLSSVDIIAAEDTRHSKKLVQHYGINTRLLALHEHNERSQVPVLVESLQQGRRIALITDAGTPLVSDPGFRLVRAAHENNIRVSPIPGPCAAIAALSVSGLACDRFSFEGFLSAKTEARLKQLVALAGETRTMIFYEAPHRILETLNAMVDTFGGRRPGVLAREISKTFETIKKSDLSGLLDWVQSDANQQRGEIVLLVEGRPKRDVRDLDDESRRIMDILLAQELSKKQAAQIASNITGVTKKRLYQYSLDQDQQRK